VTLNVVVSNLEKAYILERAREHNIPARHVSFKGKTREEGDQVVRAILEEYSVDVVLMIGYMRIVSEDFVNAFKGQMINVHPSLLPKFGGGMDTNVHKAVLEAGETESGCTVHLVSEEVDGGEILVQKTTAISTGETVETLKRKVQVLEGAALLEVLMQFVAKRNGGERESMTYKGAGVDVEMGNTFVERIKPFVKGTKRLGADATLGGFGAMFDLRKINYKDPILCSTTDGVGTKLLLAQESDNHHGVGIDLVAMCVNDLIVQGAEPLFFLDYFATGALDLDTSTKVVASICSGCKEAGCALIGGETAEMPDMYAEKHYDLAGFSVGIVEREQVLPKMDAMQEGDQLIMLPSNGIHSNGFSLVRRIIKRENANLAGPTPYESQAKNLADSLLMGTRIYVRSMLPLAKKGLLLGAAHITGGGLTENIPRVLPSGLGAKIDLAQWETPPVFKWLQSAGNVKSGEMLRTFNCGVGMVLVVSQANVQEVLQTVRETEPGAAIIGSLFARKESCEQVVFANVDEILS